MAALTPMTAPDVRAAKRLVVKIGSALLVDRKSGLKQGWLSALAMDVAEAKVRGTDVVLVSSGSIALGRIVLGLPAGPLTLEQSQAAAAVESAQGNAIQVGLPPNPSFGFEADTIGSGGTAGQQGAKYEQLIKTAGKLKLAQNAALMDVVNAQVALRRAQDAEASSRQMFIFGR